MCPKTDSLRVSIDALDLSRRAYNALQRAGISMVARLAVMRDDELLAIPGLGNAVLAEIREKLTAYLEAPAPAPPSEAASPEATPEEPEPADDLQIEPPVESQAWPPEAAPLHTLGLSDHAYNALLRADVTTIGELLQMPASRFLTIPRLGQKSRRELEQRLRAYLDWLGEESWADVVERRASPPQETGPGQTTLATQVADWLSTLKERQRQVIRWRYGLQGERLTLKQAGQRLGITRERVRQIQARALKLLAQPRSAERMAPIKATLSDLVAQAGGLMGAGQLEDALGRELALGDVDPIGVARLVARLDDDMRWVGKIRALGLTRYPLSKVENFQRRMARLLRQHEVPMPVETLLARFKKTKLYKRHQEALDDDFVIACLRAHPDVETKDGTCALIRLSSKRLDAMVVALRELGEPSHFSVITERANAQLRPEQRMSTHNVHSHLHRRPGVFVRVGRGIFGLAEWGLPDDGSLANAAYRVLAEAGRPLDTETITNEVLKTWHARRSSVYMAIANDARFRRVDRTSFGLTQWESGQI